MPAPVPQPATPQPYDELDERPRWPCTACGTRTPLDEAVCQGCGAAFLAGLQGAGTPTLALPGVGDLTRLSTGRRVGLALAAVVLLMLATAVLGLLFS